MRFPSTLRSPALTRPAHSLVRNRARLGLLAAALVAACSDPQAPQVEALGSLALEAPASVPAGSPFTLVVEAVGDEGTRPLTSFDGTVTLSTSLGSLDPASVTLVDGRASVTATLGPTEGTATLQATSGSISASVDLDVGPPVVLLGAPSDPAVEAIPELDFEADPSEYVDDHPELPGLSVSFKTVLIAIDPTATVGEVNDLLAGRGAEVAAGFTGVAGEAAGILVLRMPFESHDEMDAFVEEIQESELLLAAAPDSRTITNELPNPNGAAAGWVWDGEALLDGNWGLELSRVPQMWNLNEVLEAEGDPFVDVGLFDGGFFTHPDLVLASSVGTGPAPEHGTHVAGIIGASHDNGVGIDGVTPYPLLHGATDSISSTANIFSGIRRISAEGARVINLSLGENWRTVHPDDAPARVRHVRAIGNLFESLALSLDPSGQPPLFVTSAGNDSNRHPTPVDARFNSGWANAALEDGFAHVVVVEAIERNASAGTTTSRAEFSNPGGHVSAPGVHILSTADGAGYQIENGTSMAAPFVTGLAAYLLSLEPTLANEEIIDILTATALPVDPFDGTEASDRVDAFAAALDIDRIRGDDRVLRMLLDVDDGTPDGNLRADPGSPTVDFLETDADGNGRPGDGVVDMSDFRRWRDHFLQVEGVPDLSLDGSPDHPKRDLNGNGLVVVDPDEALYPSLDFNGDGLLSPFEATEMSGHLAGTGPRTDLEVLQALFDDPDYDAAELPELLESGDIQIQLSRLLVEHDGEGAEVGSTIETVFNDGSVVIEDSRVHTFDESVQVYTLAASELPYRASAWVTDAAGDTLCLVQREVTVTPGSDEYWTPTCEPTIEVTVGLDARVEPGVSTPVVVRAGIRRPGSPVRYQAGLDIALSVVGGAAAVVTATTNEDGFFSTTVVMNEGVDSMTVTALVSDPEAGISGTASATTRPLASGEPLVTIEDGQWYTFARAVVGIDAARDESLDELGPSSLLASPAVSEGASASASLTAPRLGEMHSGTVEASSTLSASFTNPVDGPFHFQLDGTASGTGTVSDDELVYIVAEAGASSSITFTVSDTASYSYEATGDRSTLVFTGLSDITEVPQQYLERGVGSGSGMLVPGRTYRIAFSIVSTSGTPHRTTSDSRAQGLTFRVFKPDSTP